MKKSTLYAPRLKGDLELGREPSRVSGPAGDVVKNWSRADFPGERIPGMPEQEIGAESELANYRIGTRRVQDERTFHYCHAEATYGIEKAYYGCQDDNRYKVDGSLDCWEGTVDGAVVAGTYELTVADTTVAHGADHFAGGWVFVRGTNWLPQWLRIRSSTASATTPANSVTLTLWDPLVYDVADTRPITVYPSIYSNVMRRGLGIGDPHAATVCVSTRVVQADYFFWGQTYGPCIGTPNIAVPGLNNYEQNLVFNADGSIRLVEVHSVTHAQLAGHSLLPIPTDLPPQSWFPYMLKLAP